MDNGEDTTSGDLVYRNLLLVCDKLTRVHQKLISESGPNKSKPRLVAVSKTKPIELVLRAYNNGQRHFGENYVQALVEKSSDPRLASLEDICWHFIGHLQRNKCNNLVACPHLWAVETIDSERLASSLNTSWGRTNCDVKLNVFVQVNTSGETSKSGCRTDSTSALVKHITDQCIHLKFCGLMTIGSVGHDYTAGPNPDFDCLVEVRRRVCEECEMEVSSVELSMGMSADYEEAVYAGSTNVRVGSSIFGYRSTKELAS